MSKYLSDKLETTSGAYIDELCIIASEIFKPGKSDVIEDFENQPFEKVCNVLDWQNNEKVHNLIKNAIDDEDESLAILMHQNRKNGFLATVHFPKCSDFHFINNEKEPKRWQVSQGVCTIAYIYADCIAELFDKIVAQSEIYFEQAIEKETQKN